MHRAHVIFLLDVIALELHTQTSVKLVLLHFTCIHFPLTLVIEDWLEKKEKQLKPTKTY